MKKRVLVYAYYAQNFGDDLFLKVLFDRYPDVEWELLTANRNYNKIFLEYPNVRIIYSYRQLKFGESHINPFFILNNKLFNYKKFDALIIIGGSLFMQSPAWRMKLDERQYLVESFKRLNKKVYLLGANFGPFKEKGFVSAYRDLLSKCDDVCFREEYSYHLFKDIKQVRKAADIVFNMETYNLDQLKEKIIGFSIINLETRNELKMYEKKYIEKMVDLIEAYIKQEYKINLYSFCENEGDLKCINMIKGMLNQQYKEKVEIINYQGNINAIIDSFKTCEVIIGTRFHSIILAMLFNQKFFPIIYNQKTYNVLKDFEMDGVGNYIQDLDAVSVEDIIDQAKNNTVKNRDIFRSAIEQFKNLDSFLRENNNRENSLSEVI